MSIPAIPQNMFVQSGNGNNYVSWDIAAGATSYTVQRSLDGVTYATVGTPVTQSYLDSAVTLGIQYYYQVASTNVTGNSPYTPPQSIVPSPVGEMSLGALRLASQQRADRVNSQFVSLPEWNFFINQACTELYDLLITVYEDYFMAPRIRFTASNSQYIYPLPDGVIQFQDTNNSTFVPQPFYKLLGVDLSVNTSANAFVTVNKYMLLDRNRYLYPNTTSTIYGVINLQYRVLGTNIEFIPPPAASQIIQLLYIPRLKTLLADNDITTIGFSGWLQYVIIRAAKYALDKEESDTTKLDSELLFLKARIEESAMNRDAGQPDKITDSRGNAMWGGDNGGWNSPRGGW